MSRHPPVPVKPALSSPTHSPRRHAEIHAIALPSLPASWATAPGALPSCRRPPLAAGPAAAPPGADGHQDPGAQHGPGAAGAGQSPVSASGATAARAATPPPARGPRLRPRRHLLARRRLPGASRQHRGGSHQVTGDTAARLTLFGRLREDQCYF